MSDPDTVPTTVAHVGHDGGRPPSEDMVKSMIRDATNGATFGAPGIARSKDATRNKCIASIVTSALLLGTRSY